MIYEKSACIFRNNNPGFILLVSAPKLDFNNTKRLDFPQQIISNSTQFPEK